MALHPVEAQSSKPAKTEWATYGNARFKYFVNYPKNLLVPQREADNGDGRGFVSRDGKARLFVFGSNNVSEETVKSRFKDDSNGIELGDKVTYKARKANWYAVSGYRGDAIFYRKSFLRDGQFVTLDITYPTAQRATWDSLVNKITPSFRLGK